MSSLLFVVSVFVATAGALIAYLGYGVYAAYGDRDGLPMLILGLVLFAGSVCVAWVSFRSGPKKNKE